MKPVGHSYGVPGGSLAPDARFVANAEVAAWGKTGEQATAAILDMLCVRPGGATVFHDLTIPGSAANIDHLVVAKKTVWIIDSKRWKPGFYWKFGRRVFRGTERFEPAEKHTMEMAVDRLGRYLSTRIPGCALLESTVVVWPSSQTRNLSLWAARSMPGGRLVTPATFHRLARKRCRGQADGTLVSVLMPLLKEKSTVLHPSQV